MNFVALITGGAGAIGQAIACQIASIPGYEVVLLCRNPHKAERAVGEIKLSTGTKKVSYALVDLSVRAKIEAFAASWRRPVHVLVNNFAENREHVAALDQACRRYVR